MAAAMAGRMAMIIMRVVAMLVVIVRVVVMSMVMPAAAAVVIMLMRRAMIVHMQHVARRGMVVMLMVVVLVTMMFMAMVLIMPVVMATAAVLAMGVMMSMIVVAVIVVRMAMRLGRLVGAALRLKRRLNDGNRSAEATDHVLQNGIAGDTDTVGQQLGRYMAVAEMPGETREMMRILRHDFRDRLFSGSDGDDAAIIEQQAVPVLQTSRVFQIEQERHVALTAHGNAAAVAAVMRQHDAIGGAGGLPAAGGQDRTGTDHGQSPRSMSPQRWCAIAAMPCPGSWISAGAWARRSMLRTGNSAAPSAVRWPARR